MVDPYLILGVSESLVLRVSIKMQKNELRVNFYTRVLNTKQNKVGELVFETIADKSTTSGNSTQVFALSLTAGTWLIESQVTWVANTTGRRIQSIRQGDYYNSPMLAENSNMASEEGTTSQNCVGIVAITTTQNITVWVTQSSGGNLNVGGTVKAIRFK